MNLRATYQKMITSLKGGWGAMAGALGLDTVSALENYVYEKKFQTVSVHMALQMQDFSGTTLFAETIAQLSGGAFYKLPNVDHLSKDELMSKASELQQELGEWHAKYRAYTADNEIDESERADMEKVGANVHRTMEELNAVTFALFCKKKVTA